MGDFQFVCISFYIARFDKNPVSGIAGKASSTLSTENGMGTVVTWNN
jgi:hypothetical protein